MECSSQAIFALTDGCPIAAKFHLKDAWLDRYLPPHCLAALRASRNGLIYLQPWTLDGRLVGIWLLDLGSWNDPNEQADIVPRLKVTKEILDVFSPLFQPYV